MSSKETFRNVDLTTQRSAHCISTLNVNALQIQNNDNEDVINVTRKKPTPEKFDEFIPWACGIFDLGHVTIERQIQAEYVNYVKRQLTSKGKQRPKTNIAEPNTETVNKSRSTSKVTTKSSFVLLYPVEPYIPLITKYNTKGFLVELSIYNCQFIIPQRFMKLIAVCLPYNRDLNKLSIRKGGLSQECIYQISELLPLSNITEVCLDDNYVREGNYYVLLEELSSLKILSLCRCSINEVICENIVKGLEPGRPGHKLQSLSLSSNFIGDIGARQFGHLLRTNRNLLHLNLADNGITNEGATAILRILGEFQLNEREIRKRTQRKIVFMKRKIKAYIKIINEETAKRRRSILSASYIDNTRSKSKKIFSPSKKDKPGKTVNQDLPKSNEQKMSDMVASMAGQFHDTFDDSNTVRRKNKIYCIGNLSLSYLNLAFNNLDNMILKVIRQLLEYQARLPKPSSCKGLIRLMIDGNAFSDPNLALLIINALLTRVLSERV